MAILESFKIDLGFIFNEKQAKKFTKFLGVAGRGVKTMALAAVGLATSLGLLFLAISKQALAQSRFGKTIGISRDNLEAFRRVSEDLTGSGGAGRSLLEMFAALGDQFAAGRINPDSIEGLARLGIDFQSFLQLKPEEQIFAIADAYKAVDENTRRAAKALLGFTTEQQSFLLGVTRAKVRDALPTANDLAAAQKFLEVTNLLKNTAADAVTQIGNVLIPKLMPLLEAISQHVPQMVRWVGALTDLVLLVGEAVNHLFRLFGSPIWEAITDALGLVGGSIGKLFIPDSGIGSGTFGIDKNRLGGRGRGAQTQNNTVEVIINGATDPVATGKEVAKQTQDVMRNTGDAFPIEAR